MPGVARIGDTARDPDGHIGTIITGSTTVQVDGRFVAFVGSQVQFSYGIGTISQGSPTVSVENKPLARLGDAVSTPHGTGMIITASTDVWSD